ncbi:unnamed protein product [Adineta ricciae]|uniref:Uncharacterized protein n=1 Tax=Adineta ricciae TaxID=249248 RepID=A0A813ZU62_ADIRI|nr:unnamed protein product [Adineta ricciae]CAF1297073.1 unnamed protein product [Adineta ricciae]
MDIIGKILKRLQDVYSAEKKPSKAVTLLLQLFMDPAGEQEFFDLVYARFEAYDESNRLVVNERFSADIDIIIQCTKESLDTPEFSALFPRRISAYFYIYRRVKEYIRQASISQDHIKPLRNCFQEKMIHLFTSTRGIEPNLAVINRDIVTKIEIGGHLSSVKEINDTQTLAIFLCLCKLYFQSLPLIGELGGPMLWTRTLSQVQVWKMSLKETIEFYLQHKRAFEQCPLNESGFAYLARKLHPEKNSSTSPFESFMEMLEQLSLDHKGFFLEYKPVFQERMYSRLYEWSHVVSLLSMLSKREELYGVYLPIFMSGGDLYDSWEKFILICKCGDMNEIIQNHLTKVLIQRTQNESAYEFMRSHEIAKKSLEQVKEENRPYLMKILEEVTFAFLNKQLHEDVYFHKFSETILSELLDMTLLPPSTTEPVNRSCSLVIRHLLFKSDKSTTWIPRRIKGIFDKLNKLNKILCERYDVINIIPDEWLTDHILSISQESLKMSCYDYQTLCDSHNNNSWSIHIWSRLIWLSLNKIESVKSTEVLAVLNKWFLNMKHDTFDENDTLTIIFVKNVFELVISKQMKAVLSVSNIEAILQYSLEIRAKTPDRIDTRLVDEFVENAKQSIKNVLLLQGTCKVYLELPNKSIAYQFLPQLDLSSILTSEDPQRFKFPVMNSQIEKIMSIPKPDDIDITSTDVKDQYFSRFIEQVKAWIQWFNKFLDIFQYVIERFKTWKMEGAEQLFNDIYNIRQGSETTVLKMKMTVQQILKMFSSFTDLYRLCGLFDYLEPFRIICNSSLSHRDEYKTYIEKVKRSQPNNTFTVKDKNHGEKHVNINERRRVRWSLACMEHPCNINIVYRVQNPSNQVYELYDQKDVHIHQNYLYGEFETQDPGQLEITINNRNGHASRVLWYSVEQHTIPTCHLFHGIFDVQYKRYFNNPTQLCKEKDLSQLITRVFSFIDKLLRGDTTLQEMDCLKTLFHDKNINVGDEVKKLFTNQAVAQNTDTINDQEIAQVCEWLRTYQYYSHLSGIVSCVRTFKIVSNNKENDQSISNLSEMTIKEDCSLKEIPEIYKELNERFRRLTHHHLQLIKIIVECANVVELMKNADLYCNNHGLRRFQELRDNLTTQFQLQERNSMILNSWIITYALCKPFVQQVASLDEFVASIAQLSNIDESSLKHIKLVSDNIQIVTMWLSAEGTTMLDNALITMEYLYKTGVVHIDLRRLLNEQSELKIEYAVEKMVSNETDDDDDDKEEGEDENMPTEQEVQRVMLSSDDIDDHKRQLTFCQVDLPENMILKKILLSEQLKLFQTIEKIHSILIKLEINGHPEFQLQQKHYPIYDTFGRIKKVLSNMRNDHVNHQQQEEFESLIRSRTNDFELIYRNLETTYDLWIKILDASRYENRLLKLFSNRQLMIMIILLTTSPSPNSIQRKFLDKLYLSQTGVNLNDRHVNLAIHCLSHYLQSIRLSDYDSSMNNIADLYHKYQIEQGTSIEASLKQLGRFFKDLFHSGKELSAKTESQQFLVSLSSVEQQSADRRKLDNDLDVKTCCLLVDVFHDRLPSSYQILWCSVCTEDDIRLFFSRVRNFSSLTFVVMDIDGMHHRLRELLLNEQNSLTKESKSHGSVYYFSRELITGRKGLQQYIILPKHRNPTQMHAQLRQNNVVLPQIQIVCGAAGSGKTHYIKTKYKDENTLCISINDKINVSSLIRSFLAFESQTSHVQLTMCFNLSIHAPFEQLNRILFSLFLCRTLHDVTTGLTFSLSTNKHWKFIIEVPYISKCNLSIKENFNQILPLLAIISPNTLEEVTNQNYELFIGEEEELVARFLKAYQNETIDQLCRESRSGKTTPIQFDPLTDHNECRTHIYNCISEHAPNLPRNKIVDLSFTKFLYRRVRFFTNSYYCYNMEIERLGSIAMKQMIDEARSLTQIDFSSNDYPKVYLVYDSNFSLNLLHNNWEDVPWFLQYLFNFNDPATQSTDYYIKCLAWLIDIPVEAFVDLMHEKKFILTENFAYKLFHIHERKLTKLALILEGETGVGKTFLLQFYSALLNANITYGKLDNRLSMRIPERISLWLLKEICIGIIEKKPNLLNILLRRIALKLQNPSNDQGREDDDDDDDENDDLSGFGAFPCTDQNNAEDAIAVRNEPVDRDLLSTIKSALGNCRYDKLILRKIWKTILMTTKRHTRNVTKKLICTLHDFVTSELINSPLILASPRLSDLLKIIQNPTVKLAIEIFDEFLLRSQTRPLFYRLLLHPGVTEKQIEDFLAPVAELARQVPTIELVVFFDEVNTSSCLGLFKEMFMDGTLHGNSLPKNIFFTAAINPSKNLANTSQNQRHDNVQVHRRDYLVHQLPQSLESLKVSYGILDSSTLADYVRKKIALFTVTSSQDSNIQTALDRYVQDVLTRAILAAQEFCERRLGSNSVSQREIQRCFNLIDFFSRMKYDGDDDKPEPIRCIALSLALIYYFRLPTKEDNMLRKDDQTPSREELSEVLSQSIPQFTQTIQDELERFVNTENFVIPHGVAVNQAIREHIFSIVVSISTRTPLCIIGAPGQSKTLSFQIVLQNLQGSQLSVKPFCKRLPAIDPFFCLGSKYSRSEDIAYVFDRAIRREHDYRQNRIETQCVVFLDEASLPDENQMVLKVLHSYLDECKVAFVAVANKAFDAAKANRMICVYRSLPSQEDQKILAYGCLGLQTNHEQTQVRKPLEDVIYGLCQGYRRVLSSANIPQIFHDRDFIYMLRELRFELPTSADEQEIRTNSIQPMSLLRALEDNFNGINRNEFEELVQIFFRAIQEKSPNFRLPPERNPQKYFRDIPTVLRDSMKLNSKRRRLYGRYKLIIDESEDESATNLLYQTAILDSDPSRTTVFRMSDFADDVHNELRNVEILSTIKLCMETGKTILMVNTSRIHGSLYDVFNQNFSIMATGDMRKIFSKVAIGPKTIDVAVHEDFQCIIHIKRSELKDIPAPFLSRFQKYSLSVSDFYRIRLEKLPREEQLLLRSIEDKVQSFVQHFGRQYFYGMNDSTLHSCLLSLIQTNENDQYTLLVSPESIILKLPIFEDKVQQWLCHLYFQQQEHFNIENFIYQLVSSSSIKENSEDGIAQHVTTKVMIFTRTSSYVIGLNQQSKMDLFNTHTNENDDRADKIEILNLNTVENSLELQDKFQTYAADHQKNVLMIVIDGRIGQQRLHIPYVRQLIDETEQSCNTRQPLERKYFLILFHSSTQDLYHQICFPSIFLRHWEFCFFDTCAPGSAFHLRKMLQIISTHDAQSSQGDDDVLCDLNILFEDCLWDFCSRLHIILPDLSADMFTNELAHEFYQRQTNKTRRVKCLKNILQQSMHLQRHIVDIYHDYLSKKKNSSKKIYNLIYQISKDILCGKRFTGLIDSIQSQTRHSFTNFVSNIFKLIINDYGLDTLTKISTEHQHYGSLLSLIDYQTFANDEQSDHQQGIFQLVTHYSCIPETPLYHLLHKRIKSLADNIKLNNILKQTEQQEHDDRLRDDYYANPPANNFETFRYNLMTSIMNDKTLVDIIGEHTLHSYSNDLVRTYCTIAETNFNDDRTRRQQTVEFIAKWLLLTDENDQQALENCPNKLVWLFAHVYTSYESEQSDLISMYSACRIMDRLDSSRQFHANFANMENETRSSIRERFFRLIFDYLWQNLRQLCLTNESNQEWVYAYTFVSKYYPSEKVLQSMQLTDIKNQIEFMNLAYLIFLNNNIIEPQKLVAMLLGGTNFAESSICIHLLSDITDIIQRYLRNNGIDNSTVFIDLQQWILTILKSSSQHSKSDIQLLLKYVNNSTEQITLPMKQFLFDELMDILLKCQLKTKQDFDVWNRLEVIPVVLECLTNTDSIENYQMPYQSRMVSDDSSAIQPKNTLIDLYFFHIQRRLTHEPITCALINKGMLLRAPRTENRRLTSAVERIFHQLKDYLRIQILALLLSQPNRKENELEEVMPFLSTIVTELLSINQETREINLNLRLFLSTIISKQSWNFLLNLLKPEQIQRTHSQWATYLHSLLDLEQKHSLQLHHQIQFTSSPNTKTSTFAKLHQPYQELRDIIDICIQTNTWKTVSDWIKSRLNSNTNRFKPNEISAMLLLHIYYDFYCSNQLNSITPLLDVIQTSLQLSTEEFRVFQALLQPKQFMIGYSQKSQNFLNNIFQLETKNEFELTLRHLLVNLLAMILLGGKQSFLWSFLFQPVSLQHTFGFGSTSSSPILSGGVHYDCGCIISENGELVRFDNSGHTSMLSVPAVYVAYFSTFGAMAWYLLLNERAVEHLNGPILSTSAIMDNRMAHRLVGDDIRAKVCHFVCTRILSSFHFLSTRTNQTDVCLLLNRCFERMAYLTQEQTNGWIRASYRSLTDQHHAEAEYQNQVFYFIHERLSEHKTYINNLNLKSEIQRDLQNFIDHLPAVSQFTDFKTALYHPRYSQPTLKILRDIFNSFDFLKITKLIYELSQFYLLIHQTFTQLIERTEFVSITLKELYDRGQKYYQQHQNEERSYQSIIDSGIEAVNQYHQFTNGLIRPGACDETQRFPKITIETPVSYLATNENHDEGDIIMRIISVLVDYHNNMLELIEKEFNSKENVNFDALKALVNALTLRQVSILKVAHDNTGVITLTEQDCLWIERLSHASLDSSLSYDFLYVQSQILRTYFLLCRINYRHIHQKYQCHTKRVAIRNPTNAHDVELSKEYQLPLPLEQCENEWGYLKDMSSDKLYHGYNFLRQIALTLQNDEDDKSSLHLYQFIKQIDSQNEFDQRVDQYEIKDFQLCYINQILTLYNNALNECQQLYIDVSHLLRVHIDVPLKDEFIGNIYKNILQIDYKDEVDKIHAIIQHLTEFLNDLKSIEDTLLQQCSQSLVQTCKHLAMENVLLLWIPEDIRCEHYFAVITHLIRVRSILQERKLTMEEKQTTIWSESESTNEQHENRFHQYLQTEDEKRNEPDSNLWILPAIQPEIVTHEQSEEPKQAVEQFTSLIELHAKSVPLLSSQLTQQTHQYRTQLVVDQLNRNDGKKFVIRNRDGNPSSFMCKCEKFYEKIKKYFTDKNYDSNQFVILDQANLCIDLSKTADDILYKTFLECSIVERQSLIAIRFQYENSLYEYLTTISNNISTVIHRFLTDQKLNLLPSDDCLCFFDEYGICLDDERVGNARKINDGTVNITVTKEKFNTSTLCEVNGRNKQNKNQICLFHPATQWKQIDAWLVTLSEKDNSDVTTHAFVLRERKTILESDQVISTTLNDVQSTAIIDVIDRNSLIEVTFSTETNTYSASALKSISISCMLQNQDLLQQLNLGNTSSNDYVLVLKSETNEQIITQTDFERSLSDFCANEAESILFRVMSLILMTKHDDGKQIRISLPNLNITIEQLLKLTDTSNEIYHCLASNQTKKVFENDQLLTTINSSQFLLCKENETCLVELVSQDDTSDVVIIGCQRYVSSATLGDVCKQNQLDTTHCYLLYGNEYVPSINIPLASFQAESPIQFRIINDNLPVTVLVKNIGSDETIQLHCSPSMTAERLRSISCRLLGLDEIYYELVLQDDETQIDGDITLEEMDCNQSEIRFHLTSTKVTSCSVTYSNHTITLCCLQTASAATLIKDALEKLHISCKSIDEYELIALTDDRPDVDQDLSMDDIRSLFSSTNSTMAFELRKKNDTT